jgi:transposase
MAFLGEQLEDQTGATPFSPRCQKDIIEEEIFFRNSNLFSGLDLVFFDTTSLYFEGQGGETLGERGFSKDNRPDLKQMIVGAVIDNHGRPICCELWPGNTADVNALIPITRRMQERFNIRQFCIVSDRGMISAETLRVLESPDNTIPYILGVRMRKVKDVKMTALSQGGRYKEIYPYSESKKGPAPLKVKEVFVNGNRYIICVNERQAFKDINDRNAIISSLKEQLKKGPKTLIGNKGYRKYLKIEKQSVSIDFEKVKYESRFDGKWVLRTNTDLPAEQIALKYKELWQVERVFRDVKSVLETRPIYHQNDATIRGHVFCSFLALMLRKELLNRLDKHGVYFEWDDIKRDLERLQEITIEENEKQFAVRSQCTGSCGIVMQAIGVSAPPTIREL